MTTRPARTEHVCASRGQRGATLLELLVVVVVLGGLAGGAVLATGGLLDAGQGRACALDKRTLETALEAHAAVTGAYVDEAALVSAGRLESASTLHDVVLAGDGAEVVAVGACAAGAPDLALGSGATPAAEVPTTTVPTTTVPTTTVPTTTVPIPTTAVSSIVSVRAVNLNTNQWRATATVRVVDDLGAPVDGATVTLNVQRQGLNGAWTSLGDVSRTTDATGSSTVTSAVVNKYPVPAIRFRTASVRADGLGWQPDGDWSEVRRPSRTG